MAVKNVDEEYRCKICRNEVVVTKVGGGTLVCCGKEMEKFVSGQYDSTARDLLGGDGG